MKYFLGLLFTITTIYSIIAVVGLIEQTALYFFIGLIASIIHGMIFVMIYKYYSK